MAEILALEYGIGTRAGSFCTYELMRSLKNISIQEDKIIGEEVDKGITANIPGLVRASFSIYNNVEDVNRLVIAIKKIAEKSFEYYKQNYRMNEKTGDWFPKSQS